MSYRKGEGRMPATGCHQGVSWGPGGINRGHLEERIWKNRLGLVREVAQVTEPDLTGIWWNICTRSGTTST